MKFGFLIEPPFNYRSADLKITGCDVELAQTVLPMAGIRDLELVETEFSHLLPGVAEGRWRMTTGVFVTEERRAIVSFSRPIWALSDGLLVRRHNPKHLTGYRSMGRNAECIVAVIRNQVQYQSVLDFGASHDRVLVCETYEDAARAVLVGRADAYVSVSRAHHAYLERNADLDLEVVLVPPHEKKAALGAFAFSKSDDELKKALDDALLAYLGSDHHRSMMRRFGLTDAEMACVASDAG